MRLDFKPEHLFEITCNGLEAFWRQHAPQLAERLGIRQSNGSKLERRADLHVSTLRDVEEAMGGELRVTAHFPDAEYELDYVGRATGAAA